MKDECFKACSITAALTILILGSIFLYGIHQVEKSVKVVYLDADTSSVTLDRVWISYPQGDMLRCAHGRIYYIDITDGSVYRDSLLTDLAMLAPLPADSSQVPSPSQAQIPGGLVVPSVISPEGAK